MNPVSTRPRGSLGTGKRNVPGVLKRAQTMHDGYVGERRDVRHAADHHGRRSSRSSRRSPDAQQKATGTKDTRSRRGAQHQAQRPLDRDAEPADATSRDWPTPSPRRTRPPCIEAAGLVVAAKADARQGRPDGGAHRDARHRAPRGQPHPPRGQGARQQARRFQLAVERRTTARRGTASPRRRTRTPRSRASR